ncbi:glycosyltransferase family 4 protein [Rhizobium hainanense]|uniref:glycosyltransferase family 4 protein n=1 Tax=Rhizobium hainanense TaxID=52131 RepID=UPI00096AAD25|nr:glycosyltransferase family 1 protein [Rhizobium hainanense]
MELARYVRTIANKLRLDMCVYNSEVDEFRRLSVAQEKKIDAFLSGELFLPSEQPYLSDVFTKIDCVTYVPEAALFRFFFGSFGRLRYSVDPIENDCLRGWICDAAKPRCRFDLEIRANGKHIYTTRSDRFRIDLKNANIVDGSCAFEIPIMELLEPLHSANVENVELVIGGRKPVVIARIGLNKSLLHEHSERRKKLSDGERVVLESNDVYLTAGLDWDNKNFKKIYTHKTKYGFAVAGFCYDLIPVKYPQWCMADVASFFSNYFVDLSWCADHLFCISERSQIDYVDFATRAGCRIPKTSTIRLGSNFASEQSVNVSQNIPIKEEVQKVLGTDYILYVSTIERRKNHEVLYRAYTRLIDRGIINLPNLVLVGMPGWGTTELLSDIANDPRTKGLIAILNHVNDSELSSLYANAKFTVFPSLYEGWGLPVAESLAHGKFCLCSDQGSLVEIAGDLLEYIDPWNVQEWADRILILIQNPTILAEREKEILEKFQSDSWFDCVSKIFKTIEPNKFLKISDRAASLP